MAGIGCASRYVRVSTVLGTPEASVANDLRGLRSVDCALRALVASQLP